MKTRICLLIILLNAALTTDSFWFSQQKRAGRFSAIPRLSCTICQFGIRVSNSDTQLSHTILSYVHVDPLLLPSRILTTCSLPSFNASPQAHHMHHVFPSALKIANPPPKKPPAESLDSGVFNTSTSTSSTPLPTQRSKPQKTTISTAVLASSANLQKKPHILKPPSSQIT